MAKYILNNKEVTQEEFDKQVFKGVDDHPFYLDEIVSVSFTPKSDAETEEILKEIRKIAGKRNKTEETLEDILKRNMNIGSQTRLDKTKLGEWQVTSNWNPNHTGGTVFEKVQDQSINSNNTVYNYLDSLKPTTITTDWQEKAKKQVNLGKGIPMPPDPSQNQISKVDLEIQDVIVGKKESQTVEKAPIFTYCKQMKNAVEALALRSLYGHKRYEKGDDWENFSRVENGEFEYSNAEFRHALGIGEDSDEEHYVASAWNAVARLELYLRNKK